MELIVKMATEQYPFDQFILFTPQGVQELSNKNRVEIIDLPKVRGWWRHDFLILEHFLHVFSTNQSILVITVTFTSFNLFSNQLHHTFSCLLSLIYSLHSCSFIIFSSPGRCILIFILQEERWFSEEVTTYFQTIFISSE